MARMSLLDYELHERMEALNQIGESRHDAKKDYKVMTGDKRTNRTVGIHSHQTYNAYKQTSIEFSKYMKNNHKDIKRISQVEGAHIVEYLQYRQDKGMSAATISKDMAALNKVFNEHLTKAEADIKKRSYKDITRSRGDKAHDKKYNPENYRDQIDFAKGTGARRYGVMTVKPNSIIWDNGLPTKVRLKEKGGKVREANIREDYREKILVMLKGKRMNEPLFNRYTKKIDNHAFRREYAQSRYKEISKELDSNSTDYRGFDPKVLKVLTKDLGHNRIDVVVYHYLR